MPLRKVHELTFLRFLFARATPEYWGMAPLDPDERLGADEEIPAILEIPEDAQPPADQEIPEEDAQAPDNETHVHPDLPFLAYFR